MLFSMLAIIISQSRNLALVISPCWSDTEEMLNRLANRLSIKCFIDDALGCLKCYSCHGFARCGETVQFF